MHFLFNTVLSFDDSPLCLGVSNIYSSFFNLIVRLRELKGKQNFSVEHLFLGLYNEETVKLQLNAAWYFYDFCY